MTSKRPYDEPHGYGSKKQKSSHRQHRNHSQLQHRNHDTSPRARPQQTIDYKKGVSQLPSPTTPRCSVPAYIPFTVPANLPPLPEITNPKLAAAPFIHKSSTPFYDRTSAANDLTYERLEFLGDAYLEVLASRLIFHHFPSLPTGAQSQVRELLVKNETLAEYSRAYGFEKKLIAEGRVAMEEEGRGKGNKGLNKILGDVFEAYVASVIQSDAENGFAEAEKWLTGLWAPKVLEAAKYHRAAQPDLQDVEGAERKDVYNPNAKGELQKRIVGHGVKLSYEPYKDSIELKGDQLGQNKHFIACYLMGWGYERKLLGKGEGKNKVEAGNWAAGNALEGDCKGIVEECEEKLKEVKEKRRLEKEAREREMAEGENVKNG